MSISERIKSILRLRGVSQRELGKELGLTKQAVNVRLKNDNIESDEFIKAVAKLTGVSEDWIRVGQAESENSNETSLPGELANLTYDNLLIEFKNLLSVNKELEKQIKQLEAERNTFDREVVNLQHEHTIKDLKIVHLQEMIDTLKNQIESFNAMFKGLNLNSKS